MKHFDPDSASRAELIERIDLLQGRVEALSDVFSENKVARLVLSFGLTPNCAKLLLLLADGRPHAKEALFSGLYFDRPDRDPLLRIIDVMVCKLRARLRHAGIEIVTLYGMGYRLERGGAAIAAALAGRLEPPPVRAYARRRAMCLSFLWSRAGRRGRATFTSREFIAATHVSCDAGTVIRQLQTAGVLRVLASPGQGNARQRPWKVLLLGERPA